MLACAHYSTHLQPSNFCCVFPFLSLYLMFGLPWWFSNFPFLPKWQILLSPVRASAPHRSISLSRHSSRSWLKAIPSYFSRVLLSDLVPSGISFEFLYLRLACAPQPYWQSLTWVCRVNHCSLDAPAVRPIFTTCVHCVLSRSLPHQQFQPPNLRAHCFHHCKRLTSASLFSWALGLFLCSFLRASARTCFTATPRLKRDR